MPQAGDRPLKSYLLLISAFNVLWFFSSRVESRSQKLPSDKTISPFDFLIFIPAVHKLSQVITQDRVTEPIRAPFVEFSKDSKGKEKQASKGEGLQKAVGNLLTCSYCIGPWVTTAMLFGYRVRPRETRFLATVFAIVTGSDFLHASYQKLKKS